MKLFENDPFINI